jgi:hypothetical protein
MSKVAKIISFRETPLFKRGVALSAAALVACVAAPASLGASRASLLPTLAAAGLMILLAGFFMYRIRVHRLADEVMDCEDHLKVRQGKREFAVPIAGISVVEIAGTGGIHRIAVRLREPREFGATIDFLPQASLWSNRAALNALADELTARARQFSPRDHAD